MGGGDAGGPLPVLEEAVREPGTIVLVGPRGSGRSTILRSLVERAGATAVSGLELLRDHRYLVASRLVGVDLRTADPEQAAQSLRSAIAGPIVVDDAQDVDRASLDLLAAVGKGQPVVLGWRDDGNPPPLGDAVVRIAPLTMERAVALAREHGAADPEAVAWQAGQVPGLVLALCRDDAGEIHEHRRSIERVIGALSAGERRALAVLHAGSAPTIRGGGRTWIPLDETWDVEGSVAAHLVRREDGMAQLTHGLAGETAWSLLDVAERQEIRRQLTGAADPLVAVEQLVATGEEAAAVTLARTSAPAASSFAASRLLSFVADRTGSPDDHLAAATAAARLTDAVATGRHAAAGAGEPATLLAARAERLAGRVDRALAALDGCSVDGAAGERLQLELRAAMEVPLDRTDDGALGALADLVRGAAPAADEARRHAERAVTDGDLDSAVLALAVAAAGSVGGADPDITGALDRIVNLGTETGAPLASDAARLRPVAGLHAGTHGASVVDDLADLDGPVVALHRALALALSGRSGDAATVIDGDGWPETPLWESVRWWLRAENALVAGRLVTCRNAAAALVEVVPSTIATVDLARLAVARACREGGTPVEPFEPASFLAAPVAAELAALTSPDAGRSAAYAAAADAWAGRHHPAVLRCRVASASAALPGDDAAHDLDELANEADALGFRVLAAEARRSLRRAGIRTGARSGTASGLLSPREREVLAHVAEGASSREIANRLGVAPSTIDTQVKSAMQKLGARTRRQAAAMAVSEET